MGEVQAFLPSGLHIVRGDSEHVVHSTTGSSHTSFVLVSSLCSWNYWLQISPQLIILSVIPAKQTWPWTRPLWTHCWYEGTALQNHWEPMLDETYNHFLLCVCLCSEYCGATSGRQVCCPTTKSVVPLATGLLCILVNHSSTHQLLDWTPIVQHRYLILVIIGTSVTLISCL